VSFPHQLSLAAEGAFRLPGSAIRSFVKKEEGECFFRRKEELFSQMGAYPPTHLIDRLQSERKHVSRLG
jgi:hypothetical protein